MGLDRELELGSAMAAVARELGRARAWPRLAFMEEALGVEKGLGEHTMATGEHGTREWLGVGQNGQDGRGDRH